MKIYTKKYQLGAIHGYKNLQLSFNFGALLIFGFCDA